jgi:hypothetical protein
MGAAGYCSSKTLKAFNLIRLMGNGKTKHVFSSRFPSALNSQKSNGRSNRIALTRAQKLFGKVVKNSKNHSAV